LRVPPWYIQRNGRALDNSAVPSSSMTGMEAPRMADSTLELMTRLADRLSPADKQSLIKYLEGQLQGENESAPAAERDASDARPKSLRGIWRDSFPPDVDVDAILHEIRHEWEEEWPESSQP
jgi:hypothetical protein